MGPDGGGPGQGNGQGWMEGAWSGARGGLEEDVTAREASPHLAQGAGRDRCGVRMKKHAPGRKG